MNISLRYIGCVKPAKIIEMIIDGDGITVVGDITDLDSKIDTNDYYYGILNKLKM